MFAGAASAGDATEHLNLSVSAVLTVHQSYVDACVHVPLHCVYESQANSLGRASTTFARGVHQLLQYLQMVSTQSHYYNEALDDLIDRCFEPLGDDR